MEFLLLFVAFGLGVGYGWRAHRKFVERNMGWWR